MIESPNLRKMGGKYNNNLYRLSRNVSARYQKHLVDLSNINIHYLTPVYVRESQRLTRIHPGFLLPFARGRVGNAPFPGNRRGIQKKYSYKLKVPLKCDSADQNFSYIYIWSSIIGPGSQFPKPLEFEENSVSCYVNELTWDPTQSWELVANRSQ